MIMHPSHSPFKSRLHTVLSQDTVFDGFCSATKQLFLQHAQRRTYQPNQQVLYKQQSVSEIYILLSGSIQVGWLQSCGERCTTHLIQQQTAFNLVAVLQNRVMPFDYFAVGHVEVATLAQDVFLHALQQEPEAMLQVIQSLSQRMYQMFEQQRTRQMGSIPQRIAQHVLKLIPIHGVVQGHEIVIRYRMSQEHFAALLNISRQTLNKHLKPFLQQGILQWEYAHIRVLNIEYLTHLSQREEV